MIVSKVNYVLKAVFAGISSFLGVLIGATQAAGTTWSDVTLNTWLVAASAFLLAFGTVYFVPNSPEEAPKSRS